MKTGILIVGARGAGKTTWGAELSRQYPAITVFNRDEFFATHYPGGFDPYTGQISYALIHYWKAAEEVVKASADGVFLFDYFTGFAKERTYVADTIMRQQLGLDQVYAHVLLTSKERTVRQYTERERKRGSGLTEYSASWDYELFWKNMSDIFPKEDGVQHHFDAVRFIDPDDPQPILPGMPVL